MRHLVKGSKLGRTASHRKATLSALAVALIHERRIKTTVTKAKELRRFIEPLITRSKVDSTHNRRQVFAKLQDKYAVTELFEEIGPLAKDRPGGYTRVIKLGFRVGDSAEIAMIELVDFNDVPPESQEVKKKRTRRAGKSTKPSSGTSGKKEQPETDASTDQESPVEEKKQQSAGKVEEQPDTEAVADDSQASEEASDDAGPESKEVGTASDFNVDEVKEKLDDMSVEEAKKFVGEDERVTVQKALKKKIEDASGS